MVNATFVATIKEDADKVLMKNGRIGLDCRDVFNAIHSNNVICANTNTRTSKNANMSDACLAPINALTIIVLPIKRTKHAINA